MSNFCPEWIFGICCAQTGKDFLSSNNSINSISKKLELITCPSKNLKSDLIKNNIFDKDKIFYLQDAILNYKYNSVCNVRPET